MSDIVERLREAHKRGPHIMNDFRIFNEAADEIERLQEEVATMSGKDHEKIMQLRAALQEILDDVEPAAHNGATGAISVRAIARRALEERA